MDNRHFDSLTRGLATGDSRRRLLAFLGALPVAGGLAALLDPEDAEAAGRRKRRKKRHKHGEGRRRKKRKHRKKPTPPTCTPESRAQTCDGACGTVPNNCGVVVDCGPCPCSPTCAACQICDPATGQCVADSGQQGDACGAPGQVCQADGACACTTTSCPACTTCGVDGRCAACANCCDREGACQAGVTDEACGGTGTCDVCTGQEQCLGQACVCVPDCAGRTCGADGCGGSCGSCAADETCQPNGACLQNLNQFQCLCGDSTTPSGCVRRQCRAGFDTVCNGYCTGHGGYYGLGTPGTGCGPGACTP